MNDLNVISLGATATQKIVYDRVLTSVPEDEKDSHQKAGAESIEGT